MGNKQQYRIKTVKEAKNIALEYIKSVDLENVTKFGLPEIDDRFNIWRVPIISLDGEKIGEVVLDAFTTFIDATKTTTAEILENRLLGRKIAEIIRNVIRQFLKFRCWEILLN